MKPNPPAPEICIFGGLWMNGLDAGQATTAAARILIEEMLGFHTVTSQSAGRTLQLLVAVSAMSS